MGMSLSPAVCAEACGELLIVKRVRRQRARQNLKIDMAIR
jgi:predicted nucleic acid-binding Zn ribbon protein